MTPADLKRLHKYMLDVEHIGIISDEMREVVQSEWPELVPQAAAEEDAMVKDTMDCSPRKTRADRQRQRGRVLSAIRVAGSKPVGLSLTLLASRCRYLVKLAYIQ